LYILNMCSLICGADSNTVYSIAYHTLAHTETKQSDNQETLHQAEIESNFCSIKKHKMIFD